MIKVFIDIHGYESPLSIMQKMPCGFSIINLPNIMTPFHRLYGSIGFISLWGNVGQWEKK